MELSARQIRAHRLRAHHLDQKYPFCELLTVAGTCGLQNSPPGAWETAAFCRLKNCTLPQLHQVLYQKKELLQAWSIRGVPLIFPTADSDVFLSALIAQEGEEPWIYTKGIGLALDHLGMSFAELLPLVESAAEYLEDHTIKSKEELDRVLAQLVAEQLPAQKQSLWNAPSMYGAPDRQTVGGAAVSKHQRDGIDQQDGEANALLKAADVAQDHHQDAGQQAGFFLLGREDRAVLFLAPLFVHVLVFQLFGVLLGDGRCQLFQGGAVNGLGVPGPVGHRNPSPARPSFASIPCSAAISLETSSATSDKSLS